MAALAVQVVRDLPGLATLASAWLRLLEATPEATGFQSFPWASTWASAGGRASALHTLVVRDGGEVLAIVPARLDGRGELRLLGDAIDVALGPLYRPERVGDIARALGRHLGATRGVRLLDWHGLPAGSPLVEALAAGAAPGWRPPRVVETAVCPYVDLAGGWDAVLRRRSRSSRESLARKWKALGRIGHAAFEELTDPAAVSAHLPALFALFGERWRSRHESGGFASRYAAFHAAVAPALAAAGHVRLSLLRLDGRVVAFAYGVRRGAVTTSFVLGHASALDVCSPGLLLLVRTLEAACRRGDPRYDFGIGEEEYKAAWATGQRALVRVLASRTGAPVARARGAARAVGARLWVAARAVPWLRTVRREGFRAALGRPAGRPEPSPRWRPSPRVPAAGPSARVVVRPTTFGELAERLPPLRLRLAVDRAYRGDEALALYREDRLLGTVWRAGAGRRATLAPDVAPEIAVYYDPVPAPGADAEEVARGLAESTAGAHVLLEPTA